MVMPRLVSSCLSCHLGWAGSVHVGAHESVSAGVGHPCPYHLAYALPAYRLAYAVSNPACGHRHEVSSDRATCPCANRGHPVASVGLGLGLGFGHRPDASLVCHPACPRCLDPSSFVLIDLYNLLR